MHGGWRDFLKKRFSQQEGKDREFRKIFLGISIGLLAIIIAGMTILYAVMRQLIIDQNVQMSTQAFSQVQREFENVNETANEIATQVLLDDVCSEFLEASSSRWPDSIATGRVRNQLTMYQTANSSVRSIYVYSSVLGSDSFVWDTVWCIRS